MTSALSRILAGFGDLSRSGGISADHPLRMFQNTVTGLLASRLRAGEDKLEQLIASVPNISLISATNLPPLRFTASGKKLNADELGRALRTLANILNDTDYDAIVGVDVPDFSPAIRDLATYAWAGVPEDWTVLQERYLPAVEALVNGLAEEIGKLKGRQSNLRPTKLALSKAQEEIAAAKSFQKDDLPEVVTFVVNLSGEQSDVDQLSGEFTALIERLRETFGDSLVSGGDDPLRLLQASRFHALLAGKMVRATYDLPTTTRKEWEPLTTDVASGITLIAQILDRLDYDGVADELRGLLVNLPRGAQQFNAAGLGARIVEVLDAVDADLELEPVQVNFVQLRLMLTKLRADIAVLTNWTAPESKRGHAVLALPIYGTRGQVRSVLDAITEFCDTRGTQAFREVAERCGWRIEDRQGYLAAIRPADSANPRRLPAVSVASGNGDGPAVPDPKLTAV